MALDMGKSALREGSIPTRNFSTDAAIDAEDAMDAEDAHPIKPFHHVLRARGFSPISSKHEDDTRVNTYKKPNPGGGEETVTLHYNKGRGPEYGSVNSVTSSTDPEATAPRINNSPEKLDRNISLQSYRTPAGTPSKFKPAEIKAYHKGITSPPPPKKA